MNQRPDAPQQVGRADQLRDRIRAEGGRWDSKRALAACRDLGIYCTVQRARQIMSKVAEQNPGLLQLVDGTRWTYDVTKSGG